MVAVGTQRWASTLVRGLLCVVLAVAFMLPGLGDRDAPSSGTHDQISDGSQADLTSWIGRGGPRIVKRLVGIDHWAINAVVPDDLREPVVAKWLARVVDMPLPRPLEGRRAPARGPPVELTI